MGDLEDKPPKIRGEDSANGVRFAGVETGSSGEDGDETRLQLGATKLARRSILLIDEVRDMELAARSGWGCHAVEAGAPAPCAATHACMSLYHCAES